MLVALAAIALFEHRGEVGGDADHPPRAEGFDPRLLDAFENRARGFAGGRALHVNGRVVVAQLQGERVGGAAHRCGLGLAQFARRQGQPQPRPGRARRLGAEAHRDVVPVGDRPHGRGGRALEGIGRGFGFGHRDAPCHAEWTRTPVSLSSVPKQRW